jgi:hypothetical protein
MKKDIIMKHKTAKKTVSIKGQNIHEVADEAAFEVTIENHKRAPAHHMEAAKHSLDAAKNYGAGHYEKASHSSVLAYGHHLIAGEFLNDDAKHHAQTLKETNYQ